MKRTNVTFTDPKMLAGFVLSIGTQCRWATMDTETEVKMKKTGNPFSSSPVIKRQTRNGLFNVNFVNSVRRKLAEINGTPYSETEYESGETWYVHYLDNEGCSTALVHGKKPNKQTGKVEDYVQFFPMRTLGKTTYWWNGRQLTETEVEQVYTFVPEREEVEYKPRVNVFKLSSIKRLTCRNVNIRNESVSRVVERHLARLMGKKSLTTTTVSVPSLVTA